MTKKTIKELLEMEFFPTDDQGHQLVKLSGYRDGDDDVTIVAYDMPGEFPILGVGPRGYAMQYDARGNMRPETFEGDEYAEHNIEANSLTPPDMQLIVQFVTIELDGTVVDSFDTREDAEAFSHAGEQIVELYGCGYVREITDASDDFWVFPDDVDQPADGAPSSFTAHDLEKNFGF